MTAWACCASCGTHAARSRVRAASRTSHSYGDRGQLAALLSGAGLVELEEATLTVTGRYSGFDDLWGGLLQGIGPAGAYVESLSATDRDHYREALHAQVGSPAGDFVLTAAARATRGVVPR